jgi:hypothetical protein
MLGEEYKFCKGSYSLRNIITELNRDLGPEWAGRAIEKKVDAI